MKISTQCGKRCVTGSLQSSSLIDCIWAKQRRMEAMKLYNRVLEAMCTAEAQVLHANYLTSILTNERFHRCILAGVYSRSKRIFIYVKHLVSCCFVSHCFKSFYQQQTFSFSC